MSTTARRAYATPPRSQPCSKASARRGHRDLQRCKNSDVIIVTGCHPTETIRVAATFFKQAAKRGAKLIVMDRAAMR